MPPCPFHLRLSNRTSIVPLYPSLSRMRILGIETSCDETAAAVVEGSGRVLSSVIATSKDAFERLGGVIPEEAARRQVECVLPVIDQALKDAGIGHADLDAIAVTRGPGLLGSLLVGTMSARSLSLIWKKPIIGVHHTLGHLCSSWLERPDAPVFPVLMLSASGGHTDLWLRTGAVQGTLLGSTRDDAAGEAFDKGAAQLGLPYPGGPSIQKASEGGNPKAIDFPHPLAKEEGFDFSFSGLKTALKYHLRDNPRSEDTQDIAASYQEAICSHLLNRAERAIDAHPEVREFHVVGGVSANARLRILAKELCERKGLRLCLSPLEYCTDNAAMIAFAGALSLQADPDAAKPFATAASLPLTLALTSR
jgi:N6-L-threonylcarbamoyladenine synthase